MITMPYTIRKQKCKQSDGDSGNYVLKYTDKSGKKHSACHTSHEKAKGQIAAIEMRRESQNDESTFFDESLMRHLVEQIMLESVGLSSREMIKIRRGNASTRWKIFADKIRGGTEINPITGRPYNEFSLTDGSFITIPEQQNTELLSALDAQDPVAYNQAFDAGVKTGEGQVITSPNFIMKSKEFGGRGALSGVNAEVGQISQINTAIFTAIERNEGTPIDIVVGTGGFNKSGIAKNVVKCEKVSGTPKADAMLIDNSGNAVAYLSLKSASTPKQMNQWSGVSKYQSNDIIMSFINDVRQWIEINGAIPASKALFRLIPVDHPLNVISAYGDISDNPNNCDIIIADMSTIKLKDIDKSKKSFECENIWYAREPISDPSWAPTLYARVGDRNDFGIPRTRIGIFPFDHKDSSKRIDLDTENLTPEKFAETKTRSASDLSLKDLLINEELTASDKREIERISRRQARIELERAVGPDLGKAIREEVSKALGSRATREEITDMIEAVLKRLHVEIGH